MDAAALNLIVHDLKNALGSLEGELQALAADPTVDQARQAADHCGELRRQFIQFLMVYGQGERMQARCEDESPLELLQALAGAHPHARTASGEPIRIHVNADGGPAYWYFDQRLVRLAMDAALHNALRFARSQISLSLRQEDGFLVLVIDDDGPGLGAADHSLHSTGLGTELCLRVAQAHHLGQRFGRIHLFNSAGGGARFEFWLP